MTLCLDTHDDYGPAALSRDWLRALRDLTDRAEHEQHQADEVRGFPAACYCASLSSLPVCKVCAIRNGRRLLDHHNREAAREMAAAS